MVSKTEDYHSHNTHRLKVPEVKALLSKLPFIQKELSTYNFNYEFWILN